MKVRRGRRRRRRWRRKWLLCASKQNVSESNWVNRRRSSPSYDRLVGRGGNGTIVIVLRRSFDLATALPLSAVHSLSRSFLVKTAPLLESYLSSVAFVNPCELLIPVISKSDRELSIENAPQRASTACLAPKLPQTWCLAPKKTAKLGAWHQNRAAAGEFEGAWHLLRGGRRWF